jgi:hypothetical protein
MFHYALDSATLRALAPPSELPNQEVGAGRGAQPVCRARVGKLPAMQGGRLCTASACTCPPLPPITLSPGPSGLPRALLQAAAAGSLGLGAMDALQMQHLMNAQGFFGAAGMPLLLPGGDAAGMMQGEGGELGGGADGGAVADGGEGGEAQEEQQQQQEHGGPELTAEQVAAALIQPMPQDAAAAEGAMAAAAALAAAAEGQPSADGGYASGEPGAAAEAVPEADAMQQ